MTDHTPGFQPAPSFKDGTTEPRYPDPLDKSNVAADYIVAALGPSGARLAAVALRADWMTDDERDKLAPLATAIERMAGPA